MTGSLPVATKVNATRHVLGSQENPTRPAWANLATNFHFIRQLSPEEVERLLERGRG